MTGSPERARLTSERTVKVHTMIIVYLTLAECARHVGTLARHTDFVWLIFVLLDCVDVHGHVRTCVYVSKGLCL